MLKDLSIHRLTAPSSHLPPPLPFHLSPHRHLPVLPGPPLSPPPFSLFLTVIQ